MIARPWLRPVLVSAAAVTLIALVAVASRGHAWSGGGGGSRHLSRGFWDYVLTLFAVAWVIGSIVATWFYVQTRRELGGSRRPTRRLHPVAMLLFIGIILGVALAYYRFAPRNGRVLQRQQETTQVRTSLTPAQLERRRQAQKRDRAHFRWEVAFAALGVAGAAGTVILVRRRLRRRALRRPARAAAALTEVLDDTLDDLRRERDPRRAVIAAYARMERTLAAYGLGRNAFEAPLEYLGRVLVELEASVGSAQRLTDLFERAKFSQHEIDRGMKDEAIDALVELRAELGAAAAAA